MSLIEKIKSFGFAEVLKLYPDAIRIKANSKKKPEDKQSLLKLDRWMQNELCSTVKKRLKPHITRAELVDLMKWKLLRGKWRPRLVQFAESNSPDLVEDVSRKAVVLAEQDEIEEAIQKLCCMKGVGPATASAILSACIPEKCAFFADEVAQVFLEGKLNYTLKEYSSFHDQIVILSDSLNKETQETSVWNPHEVERAIWTYCIIRDSDEDFLLKKEKKIRKDLSPPASKRLKK